MGFFEKGVLRCVIEILRVGINYKECFKILFVYINNRVEVYVG